jgi:hypothetical protein
MAEMYSAEQARGVMRRKKLPGRLQERAAHETNLVATR